MTGQGLGGNLKGDPSALRQIGPLLNLGGVLAGCIVIAALLGHWADEKFDTAPVFLLVGSLFGMASGFYHFFKVVLRKTEEDKKKNPEDHVDE